MRIKWLAVGLGLVSFAGGAVAGEDEARDRWERADQRVVDGVSETLFVEQERTPGRAAFKIETRFVAPPALAASAMMDGMLRAEDLPSGQTRRILQHDAHEALVYTFIDLPFMLSDRELALRIVRSEDPLSGVHRVDWVEANDELPPGEAGVMRLSGAKGYWEFRPDAEGGTQAVHMTQTEVGSSIPDVIAYRLMKAQALDSVERLRGRIRKQVELAGSSAFVEAVRE